MLLRLLSRRPPFILDAEGREQHVTSKVFGLAFKRFMSDLFNKTSMIRQIDGQLKEWERLQIVNRPRMSISQTPWVYLRTDLWFGTVLAGGSIGHIAGVLNQFAQISGGTIFLSTALVPTVREDIPTHFLQPINKYWDFKELPMLASNAYFEKQALDAIGDLIPSFIYQRYSLNNFTGISLSRRYQVPFVLEYNGPEVWISRQWGKPLKYEMLSERIEQINLKAADVVVAVSQPMKDELLARGIEADKILVNPNGVDPDCYSPEINGSRVRKQYGLEDSLVIGFIGTFGLWHGAEVLAEAFGRLLQDYPDYRKRVALLLIGDGVRIQQVKENLEKFGVTAQSVLPGLVPQTQGPEYLAACDILVSPHIPNKDGSPFFGSPTKIFEYMAMGKGIVASDLDQIGEVLVHERTAWLVKPGDVEALTDGLKKLIDNPTLRQRLGQMARQEVVAKYTWKEHTRRIIEKLKERCE